MIPHNMTLFKFICVQYQFHGQTLPIMEIDRGQIQFRDYVSTGTEPKSMTSEHGEDDRSCALPFYSLVQIFLKALHFWLTRQRILYGGTCPNLLRGDKALILVPSDCYSDILQSLNLISLPDRRSIAFSCGCLYIFLIYCFYHLRCLCDSFYDLSALAGSWSSVFRKKKIIYNFLDVCPFYYTAFAVSGKVGCRNQSTVVV